MTNASENPKEEPEARPLNPRRVSLVARSVVLKHEDRRAFKSLLRQYRGHFLPKNDVEEGLIEDMVSALWRIRRTWAVETGLLNREMPNAKTLDESLPDCTQDSFLDGQTSLAIAFDSLAAKTKFNLLHHQESTLHRTYQRSIRVLFFLRRPPENEKNKNSTPEST